MAPRFCDHVYIVVKDIEKDGPKHTEAPMGIEPFVETHVGKLLVCHFCGHKKSVYEDGTIIDHKANGSTGQN